MSLTSLVLLIDMIMWIRISIKYLSLFMIVINTLPFYTMYVYTMVIELNFWYLVRMIQVRLDDLKNNLFQLMQTVQSEKSLLLLLNLLAQKPLIAWIFLIIGPVTASVRGKNADNTKPLAINGKQQTNTHYIEIQISNYIKVYEQIYDATIAVNDFYGLIILV